MVMSIGERFGKSSICFGIGMTLDGSLAARLGSWAICAFNGEEICLDVQFSAYQAKVRNISSKRSGAYLPLLVENLDNMLQNRDDALAAAYLPWFVQRDCRFLVDDDGRLKVQLFLQSGDCKKDVDYVEEAARLCNVVMVAYSLDPQPYEPQWTYYTSSQYDEGLLEEIHRLNARKLAALL